MFDSIFFIYDFTKFLLCLQIIDLLIIGNLYTRMYVFINWIVIYKNWWLQ